MRPAIMFASDSYGLQTRLTIYWRAVRLEMPKAV